MMPGSCSRKSRKLSRRNSELITSINVRRTVRTEVRPRNRNIQFGGPGMFANTIKAHRNSKVPFRNAVTKSQQFFSTRQRKTRQLLALRKGINFIPPARRRELIYESKLAGKSSKVRKLSPKRSYRVQSSTIESAADAKCNFISDRSFVVCPFPDEETKKKQCETARLKMWKIMKTKFTRGRLVKIHGSLGKLTKNK